MGIGSATSLLRVDMYIMGGIFPPYRRYFHVKDKGLQMGLDIIMWGVVVYITLCVVGDLWGTYLERVTQSSEEKSSSELS
jgi:hypothetical protein